MNGGSLSLGRYAGIPVRAHWSIALIVLLFGTVLAERLGLTGAIVATLAFFASIVAHEFGHALVARRYGVQTESIDLWLLGGVASLDREPPTPRADGLIAVAGPAVSLLIGVVALGTGFAFQSAVLGWVGLVNLLLTVFNMLPGAFSSSFGQSTLDRSGLRSGSGYRSLSGHRAWTCRDQVPTSPKNWSWSARPLR